MTGKIRRTDIVLRVFHHMGLKIVGDVDLIYRSSKDRLAWSRNNLVLRLLYLCLRTAGSLYACMFDQDLRDKDLYPLVSEEAPQ